MMALQELKIKAGNRFRVADVIKSRCFLENVKMEGLGNIIENLVESKSYGNKLLLSAVALCMIEDDYKIGGGLKVYLQNEPENKRQNIKGRTHIKLGKIFIEATDKPEEFAFVLLHEFAHYVTRRIVKQGSFIRNYRDFKEFYKAVAKTIENIKTIDSKNLDENGLPYIKYMLYERLEDKSIRNKAVLMDELLAQVPVLILYGEMLPSQRANIEMIASPILEFFHKKGVFYIEEFIKNHPLKRKIEYSDEIYEKVDILPSFERIEKFESKRRKNILGKDFPVIFCENENVDNEFARGIIVKIREIGDKRLDALVKVSAMSERENKLGIFLADSSKGNGLKGFLGKGFARTKGVYMKEGEIGFEKNRIFVYNQTEKTQEYCEEKVMGTLLHEMAHHVIDKLDLKVGNDVIEAFYKVRGNIVGENIRKSMLGEDYKKSCKFAEGIIKKASLGFWLYKDKRVSAEEFLCDSFKVVHHMCKYPSRKAYLEAKFGPVIEYIDNRFLPLIK